MIPTTAISNSIVDAKRSHYQPHCQQSSLTLIFSRICFCNAMKLARALTSTANPTSPVDVFLTTIRTACVALNAMLLERILSRFFLLLTTRKKSTRYSAWTIAAVCQSEAGNIARNIADSDISLVDTADLE